MADDQGIYDLARKIQGLAATRARVKDQITNVQTVNGLFKVAGAGEAATDIRFPVKFMERPLMNFGAELDPTNNSFGLVTAGNYPTYDCVIGRFVTEGPPEKRFFVGAQLLIRTTGVATQNMWIHWSATAKAITNPYN